MTPLFSFHEIMAAVGVAITVVALLAYMDYFEDDE